MNKYLGFYFLLLLTLIYACRDISYPYGERLFKQNCADCHMDKGEGIANLYPSLLTQKVTDEYKLIPCIIRHGKADTTTLLHMLPMPEISEIEMTNIINYIINDLNKFDNKLSLDQTKQLLLDCQ